MDKEKIKKSFEENENLYSRLGKNIEEAIKSFLEAEKIPYLSVYHRIKDFDSFYEKIDRKKYEKPFEQIEDICGVRIICYYVSDIEKIEEIIKKEFQLLDSEDKSNSLGLKEFAYRSTHNIVKINDSWTQTPNYRGLQGLKIELQIRTVLMHAWAEIEHKLNYKNDAQIPERFQRKLFRLSAKFEEADEQFEELKQGIQSYKELIKNDIQMNNSFDFNLDNNIDAFEEFLNFYLPSDLNIESSRLSRGFEDFINDKLSFKQLSEIFKKYENSYEEIAKDLDDSQYGNHIITTPTELYAFIRHVEGLDAYEETVSSWKTVVEKWRNKMKKNSSG